MQLGMSWCGWTEQQTLATRIPAIELAYEGVVERLKACYGGGSGEEKSPEPEPQSVEETTAMFRRLAG